MSLKKDMKTFLPSLLSLDPTKEATSSCCVKDRNTWNSSSLSSSSSSSTTTVLSLLFPFPSSSSSTSSSLPSPSSYSSSFSSSTFSSDEDDQWRLISDLPLEIKSRIDDIISNCKAENDQLKAIDALVEKCKWKRQLSSSSDTAGRTESGIGSDSDSERAVDVATTITEVPIKKTTSSKLDNIEETPPGNESIDVFIASTILRSPPKGWKSDLSDCQVSDYIETIRMTNGGSRNEFLSRKYEIPIHSHRDEMTFHNNERNSKILWKRDEENGSLSSGQSSSIESRDGKENEEFVVVVVGKKAIKFKKNDKMRINTVTGQQFVCQSTSFTTSRQGNKTSCRINNSKEDVTCPTVDLTGVTTCEVDDTAGRGRNYDAIALFQPFLEDEPATIPRMTKTTTASAAPLRLLPSLEKDESSAKQIIVKPIARRCTNVETSRSRSEVESEKTSNKFQQRIRSVSSLGGPPAAANEILRIPVREKHGRLTPILNNDLRPRLISQGSVQSFTEALQCSQGTQVAGLNKGERGNPGGGQPVKRCSSVMERPTLSVALAPDDLTLLEKVRLRLRGRHQNGILHRKPIAVRPKSEFTEDPLRSEYMGIDKTAIKLSIFGTQKTPLACGGPRHMTAVGLPGLKISPEEDQETSLVERPPTFHTFFDEIKPFRWNETTYPNNRRNYSAEKESPKQTRKQICCSDQQPASTCRRLSANSLPSMQVKLTAVRGSVLQEIQPEDVLNADHFGSSNRPAPIRCSSVIEKSFFSTTGRESLRKEFDTSRKSDGPKTSRNGRRLPACSVEISSDRTNSSDNRNECLDWRLNYGGTMAATEASVDVSRLIDKLYSDSSHSSRSSSSSSSSSLSEFCERTVATADFNDRLERLIVAYDRFTIDCRTLVCSAPRSLDALVISINDSMRSFVELVHRSSLFVESVSLKKDKDIVRGAVKDVADVYRKTLTSAGDVYRRPPVETASLEEDLVREALLAPAGELVKSLCNLKQLLKSLDYNRLARRF